MTGNGGDPKIEVHKFYSVEAINAGKTDGNGHNAKDFQVNGHSKVYIGNQYFFKTAEDHGPRERFDASGRALIRKLSL